MANHMYWRKQKNFWLFVQSIFISFYLKFWWSLGIIQDPEILLHCCDQGKVKEHWTVSVDFRRILLSPGRFWRTHRMGRCRIWKNKYKIVGSTVMGLLISFIYGRLKFISWSAAHHMLVGRIFSWLEANLILRSWCYLISITFLRCPNSEGHPITKVRLE